MPKINTLLVYPKTPQTFWSFDDSLKYIRKKAAMMPTGLATIAAMLPEKHFSLHRIIDENVEPLTDSQIKNAGLILTSSMVVHENSVNEVIERAHFYRKKVVAGGPFPTEFPERIKNADYIVAGEAEITLAPFIEDFINGNPERIYTEGKVIKEKRTSLEHLTRENKPLMNSTPIPRWDLLDLNAYSCLAFQFSRGCPHDCGFCTIPANYGHIPRTKSPEQIISELDYALTCGYNGSAFMSDDNMMGNKKNLRKLLPVLKVWQEKNNFPFSFLTEPDITLAYEENADIRKMMIESGFNEVFIGLESPDLNILNLMNKKQNYLMPLEKAVEILQNSGFKVSSGFIIGNDNEKPEIFKNMFDFIQNTGIVIPMVGLLTAARGSSLYRELKQQGRIRKESSGHNTHYLKLNFEPILDGMSENELIRSYISLLENLFDDKNYYARCKTLNKRLGKNKSHKRINSDGIKALVLSLKNHLFSQGGFEYFKYLSYTALISPSKLPEAFADAIKLEHFKKITQQMSKTYYG